MEIELPDWVWQVLSWLGPAVCALWCWSVLDIRKNLGHSQTRSRYIENLRNPVYVKTYHRWLGRGLARLRRVFGGSRGEEGKSFRSYFKVRGFLGSLILAFVYAALFFLAGWAIGGPSGVGQTALSQDNLPGWQRAAVFFGAIVSSVGAFYCLSNIDQFTARIGRRPSKFPCFRGSRKFFQIQSAPAILLVVVAVIAATATAISAAGAGTAAGAVLIATAVAMARIYSIGRVIAGATAVAVAVIIAGIRTIIAFKFDGEVATASRALLLWVFLPFINAFWDWLSWGVSRLLGSQLFVRFRWPSLAWHVLADLVAAMVVLAGLVVSLVGAIGIYNKAVRASDGTAYLELGEFLRNAQADPWGPDGIWVTLMVLSTLVPTFLHFMMLVAGAVTLAWPDGWRRRLIGLLERDPATEPKQDRFKAALYLASVWPAGLMLAGLLFMATFGLVAWAGAPVSEMLYALALWTLEMVDVLIPA